MHDGRLQLLILIALVYLAQGVAEDFLPSLGGSPVNTAHLHSLSPEKLVIQTGRSLAGTAAGQSLPAVHTPFFFSGVPINSAEKEMLMTVKGIGPAMADAIISCRRVSGPFKDIEDLRKVPGVGPKRAASLAAYLKFDGVP